MTENTPVTAEPECPLADRENPLLPPDFRSNEMMRRGMDDVRRIQDELRIVAMLSANRSLADMFWDCDHMACESWWMDDRYYHLFMLLMALERTGAEKNFWARINAKGKELIAEQITADKRWTAYLEFLGKKADERRALRDAAKKAECERLDASIARYEAQQREFQDDAPIDVFSSSAASSAE